MDKHCQSAESGDHLANQRDKRYGGGEPVEQAHRMRVVALRRQLSRLLAALDATTPGIQGQTLFCGHRAWVADSGKGR
jgi:hypothetical protein